jgi:hypothetical protein
MLNLDFLITCTGSFQGDSIPVPMFVSRALTVWPDPGPFHCEILPKETEVEEPEEA